MTPPASLGELNERVNNLLEKVRDLEEDKKILEARIDTLQSVLDKVDGGTKVLIFLGTLLLSVSLFLYNLNGIKDWIRGK